MSGQVRASVKHRGNRASMFFHLSKHTSLNHRSLVRSSPRSVEAGKDAGFTARFFKISSHWGVMQIIREMAFLRSGAKP